MRLSAKIQNSHFFKNSDSIGFYAALDDEINVFPAARKALQRGKKIFFPRMNGKKIEFYRVTDLEKDLRPGKFGILEPAKDRKRIRPLDLILIPGRAFDKKGARLGRGIGYYDRLLEKWQASVRMGVAFREQLIAQVPKEAHDIDMDIVITA